MNDDQVVQQISKLLKNTSFIGYALNGGIGTKINVRNTETGKTIQALSINVDSTGEVLVVKDSEDGQYKAVTFKTAEKVSTKIIQLRKTKPTNDKKIIEYTDSDIEVFYLFVKLIDTGSPVATDLNSTWIRKGSSCTQFVGAYERCNYAARGTIGGVSHTGLEYNPYNTLQSCLNDDLGRDAKTPHGGKDEQGGGLGNKIYSTQVSGINEQYMLAALTSHDNANGTNFKKQFGYGSILDCSGAMFMLGWGPAVNQAGEPEIRCYFEYFPGFTNACTPAMQNAGYCTNQGYINSRCPLFGQELPGQPSVGSIDNSWGHTYGWKDLPYSFFYRRRFIQPILGGANTVGSFLILQVNEDQTPTIPEGFFPWVPGCPSGGQGGPYDGSGGNRFPNGVPPIQKRDMKLSTHRAEIWLGSNKKEEAIKLHELGASDLFSGMYNSFIIRADETVVDIENRLQRGPNFAPTNEEVTVHNKIYENWNKNRIDLNINPRVWTYIIDSIPKAATSPGSTLDNQFNDPTNTTLHRAINNLYNRTINLSVVDNKTQVIHLKLGLTSRSTLSNSDCKGISSGFRDNTQKLSSQSWEYQKYITITVKDWEILSSTNTLDTTKLETEDFWNTDNIKRRFFTSFGGHRTTLNHRDTYDQILLRNNAEIDTEKIISDLHFEQLNYSLKFITPLISTSGGELYFSGLNFIPSLSNFYNSSRYYALSSKSWWELWAKGAYSKKNKRLSFIVGYEKNHHQIVRSYGLGAGLTYGANSTTAPYLYRESYFEYLNSRPKIFLSSSIKKLRGDKLFPSGSRYITDRQETLEQIGSLFFFSSPTSNWTNDSFLSNDLKYQYISFPSLYYGDDISRETLTSDNNSLQSNLQNNNNFLKIMNTRSWLQRLWAQLIYDENIKVDVDSYKDVNFTLPTNIPQYKKFSLFKEGITAEYPLATRLAFNDPALELNTVLSPGKLEIANKQVTINKPTNVTLDPNTSFLVYLYPNVTVTKKTKEI